jgi:flagellar export protein FliJ
MKDFRFKLQKVLDWQLEQCDSIENRVKSLCRELAHIQARIAEVQADLVAAERQVLSAHCLDGTSLHDLAAYRIMLRKRTDSLNLERQGCETRLKQQRARWIEARKRYRVLDRLRHRKWAEYASEMDRELELLAAEAYGARWNAERRQDNSAKARRSLANASGNELGLSDLEVIPLTNQS